MNSIKSACYKFIITKQYLIHLLVPVLGIVLFIWYYSIGSLNEVKRVTFYIEMIAIMMPCMSTIAITIQYENEHKAGICQNLLLYPRARLVSHLCNLINLFLWGTIAVLISCLGFGLAMNVIGYVMFQPLFYVEMSFIIMACSICWYCISYIICYCFGNSVSLTCGVIGSLVSALMRLGLGDYIWQYVPSSYSCRICLSKISLMYSDDLQMLSTIGKNMNKSLPVVISMTMLSVVICLVWSNKWQGSKEE